MSTLEKIERWRREQEEERWKVPPRSRDSSWRLPMLVYLCFLLGLTSSCAFRESTKSIALKHALDECQQSLTAR